MKTKRCNKCKNDLPATTEFFHYSGAALSRCSSHCKKCREESYYLKRKPKESLSRLLTERFTDLKTRIKNLIPTSILVGKPKQRRAKRNQSKFQEKVPQKSRKNFLSENTFPCFLVQKRPLKE